MMREYPQGKNECKHDWQLARIKIVYENKQCLEGGKGCAIYVCAGCAKHTFLMTTYLGSMAEPSARA